MEKFTVNYILKYPAGKDVSGSSKEDAEPYRKEIFGIHHSH